MKIGLRNVRIFARHGVMEDERTLGAWFRVNLKTEVDFTEAMQTDELCDTASYADMAEIIKQEMSIPSKLLEHVAGRIAQRILNECEGIQSVSIEVEKEHPPICVECASSYVSLTINKQE